MKAEHPAVALNEFVQRFTTRLQCGKGPMSVGIDGPDCAGKTTISRMLFQAFRDAGWPCLLVHGDDYVRRHHERHRRGILSVEAFALDYFDVVETRDAINMAMAHVGPGVVIAEGMFFLSAPMRSCFDVTIRLEISEQEVMSRALKRDIGVLGSREWVVEHYERQCIPAQRIYRRFVGPDEVCDWLLLFDDGDMDHVSIVKVPEG